MSTPGQGGHGPQRPYGQAPDDRTHRRGTPQHSPGRQSPGYGQTPPPKKPWALIAVASGCILALLLGIGGGITYLAFSGGEETTAGGTTTTPQQSTTPPESPESTTPSTEPPPETATYEVISPIDDVEGSADDVWAILAAYPLTEGTMGAIGTCDLPETPVDHTAEQLQTVLDAAGACLNRVWATASSDRNLPWVAPDIVVYTWPDIPAASACDADSFEERIPRMCNLDGTLYWPLGAGYGAQQDDPAEVASMYLWDLAFNYMNTITWNTSLWPYYRALDEKLEDDPERQEEANRRYSLQHLCLASAASMRVPEASRPSQRVRDILTSEEHWTPAEGVANTIAPSSRAHWVEQGFESEGDLTKCNTWTAPAEQVT